MNDEKFYNEIFRRKSIRRYIKEPYMQQILDNIREDFDRLVTPLLCDINYEYLFVLPENIKNPLPTPRKAPHYVCFFSEKKEGYLQNAGYIMQQLSLYMSANNIGSCYMGQAKTINVPIPKGMKLIMIMSFGGSKKSIHRNMKKFKRKNINQITDINHMISNLQPFELLEAVRLSPTAKNKQNYFFTFAGTNSINMFACLDKDFFNPEFDCGIALCHLHQSAKHYVKNMTFNLNNLQNNIPNNYEFIGNIILE